MEKSKRNKHAHKVRKRVSCESEGMSEGMAAVADSDDDDDDDDDDNDDNHRLASFD